MRISEITQKTDMIDLSDYSTVFCDSLQAIKWAYQNGLPRSAVIKSGAPAVLLDNKINTYNVESRWNVKESERFQNAIQELTKDVFDIALNIPGVERELALTITQFSYKFQKIIYKAACLDEDDFNESRLFIYVNGKFGPAGNIMNSRWNQLLECNPLFSRITYTLEGDNWKTLSTKGISYWRRFKIAGYETLIYRAMIKLMQIFPNRMFSREVFMPNENELNIEIAHSLAMHGVKISTVEPNFSCDKSHNIMSDVDFVELYKSILPVMRNRIERWVTPSAIESTMLLYQTGLEEKIELFSSLTKKWKNSIGDRGTSIKKCAVLMNAPGNIKGHSLAYVCRKSNMSLISSQHGVTVEISKAHDFDHIGLDNSVADAMFSYNSKIIKIEESTHFDNSKHYNVGMPLRLIRMKYAKSIDKSSPPIVYISTNLYNMGFSLTLRTDYGNAIVEQKIVTDVLGKLPHKVRYKTYPEDNRRYADIDPVLSKVNEFNNIDLFSDKVDMRYLISQHRVFVTTCATSTLGWPVMSGKPVVFINQKNRFPLTDEAYISLSKGLFVFDFDDDNFYIDLKLFLSQSIDKIEILWKEKESARRDMIKDYFSSHSGGAGKRAARIIIDDYLS